MTNDEPMAGDASSQGVAPPDRQQVYSGYDFAELGVVPSGWRIMSVRDFGQVVTGGTPSTTQPGYWGGTYAWVTPTDISNSRDIYATDRLLTDDGLRVIRELPSNSVLVTCIASIGKNAILRVPGGCNQQINAVVPSAEYSPEFLYYLFEGAAAELLRNAGTTATPILSKTRLQQLHFAVPGISEQRAIAEALSDVDALIESLDALIAKKQAIKHATMQQLLTGRTRLPGFTGAWETKRLGEIATIRIGRTPSRSNSAFWGRGHVWLSIADLNDKVVCESREHITELAATSMTPVAKGTLLMSFKLSIGRLAFAGCDLFTNEAICALSEIQTDGEYLYYALSRTDFSQYGKQAVKGYTLNSTSLRVIEVAIPNLPEQRAIAAAFSDMDAEIDALERRREKSRAIKRGMMQQLLTGQVRLVEPEVAA